MTQSEQTTKLAEAEIEGDVEASSEGLGVGLSSGVIDCAKDEIGGLFVAVGDVEASTTLT